MNVFAAKYGVSLASESRHNTSEDNLFQDFDFSQAKYLDNSNENKAGSNNGDTDIIGEVIRQDYQAFQMLEKNIPDNK